MAYSDVALLLALMLTVALAYPTKDDESYYNRLHEFQDSYGKDVRNLDGIDARDEERPLFSFLSKTQQSEDSEKGPELKFDFGSSSHLDGIGGGHLVRDFELEQGLAPSVLDVLPDYAFVGNPQTFGVVRKYPIKSKPPLRSEEAIKKLFRNPETAKLAISCFVNDLCTDISYNDYITKVAENRLPDVNYDRLQNPFVPRYMDALGGGHLLNTKRSLDSIGGGHLLNSKKDIDSIGEDKFLSYVKDLDSIGGGHLLNYKKDLDSIGGGHLLNYRKDLDSIGGGHLLNYKKDLDSTGGGHLLNYKKDLDSIGGGHLLNYKKDLDSIGGGHLLNYKKDLDSIGGGHLLSYKKDLNSIGGGHLINYEKDLDSIGGGHLLSVKRYLDSIGGGHLLHSKKDIDYLIEDSIKRGNSPSSSYNTYQKYYSGAGLPLKSSRPLCTSSRWFQNILNNYLVKEELKSKNNKDSKTNKVNVFADDLKGKNVKFKVNKPRLLNLEIKPDVINAGMKGLSGGLPQTTSDEDQTEAPFRGIIELNKLYIPYSLEQS